MKINPKILSIPPYISTAWKNIVSIHIENRNEIPVLVIGLVNGSAIEIPNLERQILQAVFVAHQKYLEQEESSPPIQKNFFLPEMGTAVVNLPFNLGMDMNMGNLLQHNQEAASSPDLPKDVIHKIATLAKSVGSDNLDNFPKPEPHCNCMHCQIMKAIHDEEKREKEEEEEVSEEDLRFRTWDIQQTGNNLYIVTNPLNKQEQFNVFLGSPVGCTCGKENCEHIVAVLNS